MSLFALLSEMKWATRNLLEDYLPALIPLSPTSSTIGHIFFPVMPPQQQNNFERNRNQRVDIQLRFVDSTVYSLLSQSRPLLNWLAHLGISEITYDGYAKALVEALVRTQQTCKLLWSLSSLQSY